MYDNNYVADIWWNKMINTSRFLEDIRELVYQRTSVAVNFSSSIPWEAYLITDKLPAFIRENDLSSTVDIYDNSDISNPTDFIWKTYFPSESKNYWEPTHKSKERFMAKVKNSYLKQCYVVIKNVSDKSFKAWNKFLNEYTNSFEGEKEYKGVFILLGENLNVPSTSKVKCISFSDYVTDFDCLVLSMTLLSKENFGSIQKQYISALSSELSKGNFEIAAHLSSRGEELVKNTLDTAIKVENEMGINNLQLRNAVDSSLWKTQIKIIFGLIEEFRKKYVDNNYHNIFLHLPNSGMFGEHFESPYELEIKYLYDIDSKHIHQATPSLKVLKQARNDLAHLHVLDYNNVLNIIKIVKEYCDPQKTNP